MKETIAEKVVIIRSGRSPVAEDDGKLRMGAMSPSFPPVRDKPANLADSGRLRMGAMSPMLPPSRTR